METELEGVKNASDNRIRLMNEERKECKSSLESKQQTMKILEKRERNLREENKNLDKVIRVQNEEMKVWKQIILLIIY